MFGARARVRRAVRIRKKKKTEKKLTEKFPYGLVLYIVVPYEAATQKGKNVA